MGGSSKKVTVGYKYYLGCHMALCHGPIDNISQITVDDRPVWSGLAESDSSGNPSITIDAPEVFGGESREGGIAGVVDIEMGEEDQQPNDYLLSKISSSLPAFRGVCCAVLRQVYFGLNPYLKPWSFTAQRIFSTSDGSVQWYPEKAAIISESSIANTAIYIAIDISNSMAEITGNGKTRLENLKAALTSSLSSLLLLPESSSIDVKVVAFATSSVTIERRDVDGDDIATLIDWINARDYSDVDNGTTEFDVAISGASGFFANSGIKRRVSVVITDGEATGGSEVVAGQIFDEIPNIIGYGINIDLGDTSYTAYLDNTDVDGIPVVSGGDPEAIEAAFRLALFNRYDMNPAHILRECIIDPVWGLGYQSADIDNESFQAAADALYDEGMGISLLWDRQVQIYEFVQEIKRHIEAELFVDKETGKFNLKLIRDDYSLSDLVMLDVNDIDSISDYSESSFGETVNSVVVKFWNASIGAEDSVTVQDLSLVQSQGYEIGTTVNYPGFTNYAIAGRVAERDLRVFSSLLRGFTVTSGRAAAQINLGDAFVVNWPELGIYNAVFRALDVDYGDGLNNRVSIKCVEDVFSLPDTSLLSSPSVVNPGISQTPVDPAIKKIIEAPYYELVQRLGQSVVDDLLGGAEDLGYVLVGSGRPSSSGAINARFYIDAGAGYEDSGGLDFAPVGLLAESVSKRDVEIVIEDYDLEGLSLGEHFFIGDECFRFDGIVGSVVSVGRGCLDTVPKSHSIGDALISLDVYGESDLVEYADGETISAKILPVTGSGVLSIEAANAVSVTLDSRAIRPYPPGNFKINGDYFPVAIPADNDLVVSWSHRDRQQQTASTIADFRDGNIGPEIGVTYTLRIYGEDDELIREVSGLTGTEYTYSLVDEINDSEIVIAEGADYLGLISSLNILANWRFEESSGSVAFDESDNNFDLSHGVNVVVGDPGLIGVSAYCVNYTGASDSFSSCTSEILSTSSSSPAYTFIVWFSTTNTTDKLQIWDKSGGTDTERLFIQFNSDEDGVTVAGNFRVFLRGSSGGSYSVALASAIADLCDGNVHLLGVEVNGEATKFYVDGEEKAVVGNGMVAPVGNIHQTGIGHNVGARNDGGLVFDGDIDEFAVVQGSISSATHSQIYSARNSSSGATYRVNGRLTVELESVRDGFVSFHKQVHQFYRAGYGLNYGYVYGGVE